MMIAERLRMLGQVPPAAADYLPTTREEALLFSCGAGFEIEAIAQLTETR